MIWIYYWLERYNPINRAVTSIAIKASSIFKLEQF